MVMGSPAVRATKDGRGPSPAEGANPGRLLTVGPGENGGGTPSAWVVVASRKWPSGGLGADWEADGAAEMLGARPVAAATHRRGERGLDGRRLPAAVQLGAARRSAADPESG